MKKGLHPEWKETTVKCNNCGTTFKTHSTVDSIAVEICSHCHPFYTGKQTLVDTAGRVDKYRARQAAAAKSTSKTVKVKATKAQPKDSAEQLKAIKQELETETVAVKKQ